ERGIVTDVVGAPPFGDIGIEIDLLAHAPHFPARTHARQCGTIYRKTIKYLSVQCPMETNLPCHTPEKIAARLLPCGDTALTVELGDRVDRRVGAVVLALAER